MDSLEYIDGYFKGEFPPEEATLFERRIQDDLQFAEDVAFYLSAKTALKEEHAVERKRVFRELYQPRTVVVNFKQTKVRKILAALAVAAFVSGIILFWSLVVNRETASSLADQYIHQNLDLLSVKMGAVDSMQSGLILYNDKKFPEALQQFEDILRSDSSNSNAMLNAGFTSLRMQNYDKAFDFFKRLEVRTNLHLNPALFYEAITLMKRDHAGDAAHAKQLLNEVVTRDPNKKEDALQLLSKM